MSTKISNSLSNSGQRELTGRGLRAGMAKDQLIFIIICAVALAVAAVALVHTFMGVLEENLPSGSVWTKEVKNHGHCQTKKNFRVTIGPSPRRNG